ncbi:hypothetical protein MIAR_07360 [Microbacterium arabinogalactanolyticum]|uniref:Malate synthase N-terminal domain-containing protein n=1 Tax=Microbacterium arabinogalactanolyticum TaxID=69365 RepID=A0ABQ5NFB4_9MICO|nr:hypothetical protein MIAR_07360 [Microbacterium arabinogalactanolyticum]
MPDTTLTAETTYLDRADLRVAREIVDFAETSLADAGLDADAFWTGVSGIVHDLGPRNAALLEKRATLQARIDEYHRENPGRPQPEAYRAFLTEIGYLAPEPAPFAITTENVDPEIATMAGPQLVVPLLNARFALNAANARWGSLYDALYGTDAIDQTGELAPGRDYNPARGSEVIAHGRTLLDLAAPLSEARTPTPPPIAWTPRASWWSRPRASVASPTPRRSSATPATPRRRPRSCCSTTGCTSRSSSTPRA